MIIYLESGELYTLHRRHRRVCRVKWASLGDLEGDDMKLKISITSLGIAAGSFFAKTIKLFRHVILYRFASRCLLLKL